MVEKKSTACLFSCHFRRELLNRRLLKPSRQIKMSMASIPSTLENSQWAGSHSFHALPQESSNCSTTTTSNCAAPQLVLLDAAKSSDAPWRNCCFKEMRQ